MASVYRLTIGATDWHLRHDELLLVSSVEHVHPLPVSQPAVSGLIACELGILALLDTGSPLRPGSAEAGTRSRIAVVQTPKGPVALAIDGVVPLDEIPADARALSPWLDQASEGFTFGTCGQPAPTDSAARTLPKQAYLLVRSGPLRTAIAAQHVRRLDKHDGAQPYPPDQHRQWLVAQDGDLIAAESLAHRHAPAWEPGPEGWCLTLEQGHAPAALLVQEVLGLVEVAAHRVKSVLLDQGPSTWLTFDEQPPVPVFEGSPGSASGGSGAAAEPAGPGESASAERIEAPGALLLKTGEHRLVLPHTMVDTVLGMLDTRTLCAARGPHTCPVFDLCRLLDGEPARPSEGPVFAVRLRLAGRPVIVLCLGAEMASVAEPWQAAPALPQEIGALLQGVRLAQGRPQYMLASDKPSRLRGRWLASRPSAFLGWYPSHPASSPHFD